MTSKRVKAALAIAIVLSLKTNAQFRHSALPDPVRETGFYSIAITPELSSYLKTDLSDFRIVDDKKQWVPFIVDWPNSRRAIHDVWWDQKIIRKATSDSTTILITENPDKRELSNIILELKNAAAERVGSLSGSDNSSQWFVILDSLVLHRADKYSDTSHLQRINFPASTYRYFRLTIYNNRKEPLNILNASSSAGIPSMDTIPKFFKTPDPRFSQVDTFGYSLVTITPEKPFQIGMIRLNVARPWLYKRQAKIFTEMKNSVTSTWFGTSHHTMVITSDDYSGFNLPVIKSDTLYVIIENGDNPPLQISSISTGSPNRNIIAHLEKGKQYALLLDDPGAKVPVYDLEHFKDRIPAHTSLGISKVTALQSEAIPTPTQNSKWWIWPVIAAVLLSLSLLTWKLATDMKKSNTLKNRDHDRI